MILPFSIVLYNLQDVPLIGAFTMPWTWTREFPHPFSRQSSHARRSRTNGLSYSLIDKGIWWLGGNLINEWRENDLGLVCEPVMIIRGYSRCRIETYRLH